MKIAINKQYVPIDKCRIILEVILMLKNTLHCLKYGKQSSKMEEEVGEPRLGSQSTVNS